MSWSRPPLDLRRLRVYPLAERQSLTSVDKILVDPASQPAPLPPDLSKSIDEMAARIRAARQRGASVMLVYGAHLLRNGAALLLDSLMAHGYLTHLATNGAATIHDWEYAWLGRSTESVRDGVATGSFGTWDETGRTLAIALLAAGVANEGYGRGLGRLIVEDGVTLPSPESLEEAIRHEPRHPLTAARAELLAAIEQHGLATGRYAVTHRWKHTSILGAAFRHDVPITVHPGIGYDIITNHPMFNSAAIGRAAQRDFAQFSTAVEGLDGGVVLSIGSAIMGPQVFEKSLSCVNNLRLQAGRPVVAGHTICVVDLQEGGGWDWTAGEPPKTNPAYYLRFCKSYSRMGGSMRYLQCDNLTFVHHLYHRLVQPEPAAEKTG
jgi:hypothetical protein